MLYRLASSINKLSFRVNNGRILGHLLHRDTNRQLITRQNGNNSTNRHTFRFACVLHRAFNGGVRGIVKGLQSIRYNGRTRGNSAYLRVQQLSVRNRTKFGTKGRSDLGAFRIF